MNELKRQAYLQAMDIQTYFPKRILPGAKVSPAYDIVISPVIPIRTVAAAGRPQSQAIEELRAAATNSRKAAVTEIASDKNVEKTAVKQKTTPAAVAEASASTETDTQGHRASETEKEDSLNFSLRYYRINEKLAVIDEVPPQGSSRLGTECLLLMQAILKALGQESSDQNGDALAAEQFSWPLSTGYSRKNSAKVEAAKALSGFLQMRKEVDGFANLLVFAGQLENVLLNSDADPVLRDFESDKGYYITVCNSLASMLAVPTLKRDVWQHLQALRHRIDTSI
jgi:hypothetical protein